MQLVRRRHPFDGTPQAGKPYGPELTVEKIEDHDFGNFRIERGVKFYLSDGTVEFMWNLCKVPKRMGKKPKKIIQKQIKIQR